VRRREPSPEFGKYLAGLMAKRGIKAVDMARVCKAKPTFVYAVLRGDRPLPEARIDAVAEALGLKAADRSVFRLEALAAYAPREVREALWEFQANRNPH
jgi:cyanate lyase